MLKKLYDFLMENEKELKDLVCYNDYHGLIERWTIASEDEHLFKDGSPALGVDGPDNELCWQLYKLAWDLPELIKTHLEDKRTREQKYYDSIKEYNEKQLKEGK